MSKAITSSPQQLARNRTNGLLDLFRNAPSEWGALWGILWAAQAIDGDQLDEDLIMARLDEVRENRVAEAAGAFPFAEPDVDGSPSRS